MSHALRDLVYDFSDGDKGMLTGIFSRPDLHRLCGIAGSDPITDTPTDLNHPFRALARMTFMTATTKSATLRHARTSFFFPLVSSRCEPLFYGFRTPPYSLKQSATFLNPFTCDVGGFLFICGLGRHTPFFTPWFWRARVWRLGSPSKAWLCRIFVETRK